MLFPDLFRLAKKKIYSLWCEYYTIIAVLRSIRWYNYPRSTTLYCTSGKANHRSDRKNSYKYFFEWFSDELIQTYTKLSVIKQYFSSKPLYAELIEKRNVSLDHFFFIFLVDKIYWQRQYKKIQRIQVHISYKVIDCLLKKKNIM